MYNIFSDNSFRLKVDKKKESWKERLYIIEYSKSADFQHIEFYSYSRTL